MFLIRLSRPLAGGFPRELDDATARRQLELMLDGVSTGPRSGRATAMTIDGLLRQLD
jgi:hypothetical protein